MVFEPLNKVHLREGSRAALCSLDSILIDFPKGSHTTDTTRPTACTNKHTKNRRLFSLPCRKGDLLYAFQAGLLHLHNDNADFSKNLRDICWKKSFYKMAEKFHLKKSVTSSKFWRVKRFYFTLENYQALLWWIALFHIFSQSFKLNCWNIHFFHLCHPFKDMVTNVRGIFTWRKE